MGETLQIFVDEQGIAVVGHSVDVHGFLTEWGLAESAERLDLSRLSAVAAGAADVLEAMSQISLNSGRYVKLTKESARLVKKYGLMEGKVPGERHLMIGKPGNVSSWLQADVGKLASIGNPALMSGVAGLMAQVAARQAAAETVRQLEAINVKADEILRNQHASELKILDGATAALVRTWLSFEKSGVVSDDYWSTLSHLPERIHEVVSYARQQIAEASQRLERSKFGSLGKEIGDVEGGVRRWLEVTARCERLLSVLDVIQVEREDGLAPDELAEQLEAMKQARKIAISPTGDEVLRLVEFLERSVATANRRVVLQKSKAEDVIAASNTLAVSIQAYSDLLQLPTELGHHSMRPLGRFESFGADTIQQAKEFGPIGALAIAAAAAAAKFGAGRGSRGDEADSESERE